MKECLVCNSTDIHIKAKVTTWIKKKEHRYVYHCLQSWGILHVHVQRCSDAVKVLQPIKNQIYGCDSYSCSCPLNERHP